MEVVDRLETLCAADRQDQARDLATGVVQNDAVVDVELSGTAPDADGPTVIRVETDHFRGTHVLSDRADEGMGWPGRYTVTGPDTDVAFDFRTATMPAEAERLVEDRYDVQRHRTALLEEADGDVKGETNDDEVAGELDDGEVEREVNDDGVEGEVSAGD